MTDRDIGYFRQNNFAGIDLIFKLLQAGWQLIESDSKKNDCVTRFSKTNFKLIQVHAISNLDNKQSKF